MPGRRGKGNGKNRELERTTEKKRGRKSSGWGKKGDEMRGNSGCEGERERKLGKHRAKGERGKRNGRENRICEMTKGEEITKNA